MANTNSPCGLRPCGKILSLNKYGIVPGTTKLFIGDPVKKDSTGTADGFTTVDIAADTGAIVGAITSIFDSSGFPVSYYPAGNATGYTCMVADDPRQEFIAQEDSLGAAGAQADIGLGTNLIAGTGNETTGVSGWGIDISDKGTTATLQVILQRIAQTPDNALGDYCKWVITINNHQNGSHTGVAGV